GAVQHLQPRRGARRRLRIAAAAPHPSAADEARGDPAHGIRSRVPHPDARPVARRREPPVERAATRRREGRARAAGRLRRALAAGAHRRQRRGAITPRLRRAQRGPGVGSGAHALRAPRRVDRLGTGTPRGSPARVAAHLDRPERARDADGAQGRATRDGRCPRGCARGGGLLPLVAHGLAPAAGIRTRLGVGRHGLGAVALGSRHAVKNLRRQIACAALLLWATATADARAGTPAANEASAAHAEPGWTIVPLDELGLDAYTRRKWRSPTLTMRYRTRLDRVVTAARLRLAFAPGKLDGVTALAIVVNGVRVAEPPVGELQPAEAR